MASTWDDKEAPLLSRSSSEDLEANHSKKTRSSVELEYRTSTTEKFVWLSAYLLFGMLLTIYNKLVLQKVKALFNCPWFLTGMHSAFASVGTLVLLKLGYFKLSTLSQRDHWSLLAFSMLFTVNIWMSNVSLSLVSLAFFQIIRNTAPVFTVLLYRVWYSRSYSLATYVSLLPIIVGAAMTTMGEYQYSAIGLIVSIAGVVLAVIKTIVTNRLMTQSLALPMMELLFRMSPYAALQSFIIGAFSGEVATFKQAMASRTTPTLQWTGSYTTEIALFLFFNGLLSFLLNISSFQTNKVAGALSISVCGNVKQTLTLALGIFFLGDFLIDFQNGTGILLVILGCALYSKAELDSKKRQSLSNLAEK
ncbi:Drug/metabolite transporter [Penicillium alfredii]|uniref:Drug/metabolite transporter n=1 Tax=Penicillium alfredii TaxID=1506179 RepID=A0A9W9KDB8_9EURO|nr:Drug/metabolite transporter [Penicillium alfredii]KAJ5102179.1 Drug/metabolite transporter [Penicillium alfredii]